MTRLVEKGRGVLDEAARHQVVDLNARADVRVDWFGASRPGRPTVAFYGDLGCVGSHRLVLMAAAAGALAHNLNVAVFDEERHAAERRLRHAARIRRAVARLSLWAAQQAASPTELYLVGHGGGAWIAANCLDMGEVAAGVAVSATCSFGLRRRAAARLPKPLPRMAGPLLLMFGEDEPEALRREMRAYNSAWQAAGLASWLVGLPGRNHLSILDELAEADSWATLAVLKLTEGRIDELLPPDQASGPPTLH